MAPGKKKNEGQRNSKKLKKDSARPIDDRLDQTNLEVSETGHSSKPKQSRNSKQLQKRDDRTTDSENSGKSYDKDDDNDEGHELDDDLGDMTPMELEGLRKAKQYISEALDFGIHSGFLEPKDKVGNLLRVSSEIMNFQTVSPPLDDAADSSIPNQDEDVHDKTTKKRRRSRSRSSRSRKGTMSKKRTRRTRSRSISHEQGASASRKTNEHIIEKTKNDKKNFPDDKEPLKTSKRASSRSSKTSKQVPESKKADDEDLDDEIDQDNDVTDVYRNP